MPNSHVPWQVLAGRPDVALLLGGLAAYLLLPLPAGRVELSADGAVGAAVRTLGLV